MFARYFENLFSESDPQVNYSEPDIDTDVYIPILDDPISEREMKDSKDC